MNPPFFAQPRVQAGKQPRTPPLSEFINGSSRLGEDELMDAWLSDLAVPFDRWSEYECLGF